MLFCVGNVTLLDVTPSNLLPHLLSPPPILLCIVQFKICNIHVQVNTWVQYLPVYLHLSCVVRSHIVCLCEHLGVLTLVFSVAKYGSVLVLTSCDSVQKLFTCGKVLWATLLQYLLLTCLYKSLIYQTAFN